MSVVIWIDHCSGAIQFLADFMLLQDKARKVNLLSRPEHSISGGGEDTLLTIEEYREVLNDHTSTDEQIRKRLRFLQAFCRNVIRLELNNHKNKIHE